MVVGRADPDSSADADEVLTGDAVDKFIPELGIHAIALAGVRANGLAEEETHAGEPFSSSSGVEQLCRGQVETKAHDR